MLLVLLLSRKTETDTIRFNVVPINSIGLLEVTLSSGPREVDCATEIAQFVMGSILERQLPAICLSCSCGGL